MLKLTSLYLCLAANVVIFSHISSLTPNSMCKRVLCNLIEDTVHRVLNRGFVKKGNCFDLVVVAFHGHITSYFH